MSQNDLINEISAYIGLLVLNAGGEIRVPFALAEDGIPPGKVVKIHMDEDTEEIQFILVDKSVQLEEEVEQ